MTDPKEAFRYIGGNPALDLVNTVDWTEHGLRHERLSDYTRLVRWAEGAGVIDAEAARELGKGAVRCPDAARRAFRSALRVRAALQLVVKALAAQKSVAPARWRAA